MYISLNYPTFQNCINVKVHWKCQSFQNEGCNCSDLSSRGSFGSRSFPSLLRKLWRKWQNLQWSSGWMHRRRSKKTDLKFESLNEIRDFRAALLPLRMKLLMEITTLKTMLNGKELLTMLGWHLALPRVIGEWTMTWCSFATAIRPAALSVLPGLMPLKMAAAAWPLPILHLWVKHNNFMQLE